MTRVGHKKKNNIITYCQLHVMWFLWIGNSLCQLQMWVCYARVCFRTTATVLSLMGRIWFFWPVMFFLMILIPIPQQVIAPCSAPWRTWRQYTGRTIWGPMPSVIVCYRAKKFLKVFASFLLESLYICMDAKFSQKFFKNVLVLFNVKEDLWLSISSAKQYKNNIHMSSLTFTARTGLSVKTKTVLCVSILGLCYRTNIDVKTKSKFIYTYCNVTQFLL